MSRKEKKTAARNRARVTGIAAAVILFGGLSVPAAGAAEGSFSSGVNSVAVPAAPAVPSVPSDAKLAPENMKVSQEQAVAKIRKLFPALAQAETSDIRLTDDTSNGPDPGGNPLWEINFMFRTGNSSSGFSANVDAMTGDLRRVYLPYEMFRGSESYPPKKTRSQALEIAEKFTAEAIPSKSGQTLTEESPYPGGKLQISPLFGPVAYSFSFRAAHEGVRIEGQSIQVTVNGNGEVTSFNYFGGGSGYPSAKPKVTAAEAKARWESDLQLQLTYASSDYRGEPDADSWKLLYTPSMSSNMLDAQTGQWLDYGGNPQSVKPPGYVKLQEPDKPFVSKPITADEAAQRIAAYADIPEGFTLVSRSLQQGQGNGKDVWSLRWQNEKASPFEGRYAQIDATTGQLLSFNVDFYGPGGQNPNESKNSALPMEQAIKLADEWVSANIPDISSYRRVVPAASASDPKLTSEYTSVSYQLFYRDLPVQNRVLTVTFNGKGKMTGFYGQRAPGADSLKKLDTLKASVTVEQAKSMYLKATIMEPVFFRYGGYYVQPPGTYVEPTVKLVYSPVDPERKQVWYLSLDAETGKWINIYTDNLPGVSAEEPADLGKHWAAASLRTLLEHGVIKSGKDGFVHPNSSVKTGDFLQMLALAANPYFGTYETYPQGSETKPFADVEPSSPYYDAVNQLIDRKWLVPDAKAELHPEAELTRDQLAVYLSKITGYEKLASKLTDSPAFAGLEDAKSVPHPGAAALALKLGLLTPQDGGFRPNAKVSLAQLATVLVRLAEHQGEWDRPLVQ